MEHKNKDRSPIVILVGFLLIGLVGVLTFYRQNLSQEKKTKISLSKNDSSSNNENNSAIFPEDLLKKISAQEKLTILDIRDQDTFSREHLLDSKNIPAANIPQQIDSLDRNKAYVIVDDLGDKNTADLVQDFFIKNGFSNITYLVGGISNWKKGGNQTITDGDPTSFSDQAKVTYINTENLKKIIIGKEDLYLVDLRKNSAYSEGHIPGAVNISLDELEAKRNQLPMGKKIILYDNDGLWAMKGAVRLFDAGVFNVFALSDGLDEWKKKGYEVVK